VLWEKESAGMSNLIAGNGYVMGVFYVSMILLSGMNVCEYILLCEFFNEYLL
jgi:hypothetical protein